MRCGWGMRGWDRKPNTPTTRDWTGQSDRCLATVEPWQLGSMQLTCACTARPASAADARAPVPLPFPVPSCRSPASFSFRPRPASSGYGRPAAFGRAGRPRAGSRAGAPRPTARAEEGTGRAAPGHGDATGRSHSQEGAVHTCGSFCYPLSLCRWFYFWSRRGSRQRPTGHVGTTPGRCRRRPSPSPVTCKQAPQPLSNESRDH